MTPPSLDDDFPQDAIDLLRQIVLQWPAVFTDDPIEGTDAVDYLGDLVRHAANVLYQQQGDAAPTGFLVTLQAVSEDGRLTENLGQQSILVEHNDPALAINRVHDDMMAQYWDPRLDAASCTPAFGASALPVPEDTFSVEPAAAKKADTGLTP